MIVVDVGCATYQEHPDDESTWKLIYRFAPSRYYGFDPDADHEYENLVPAAGTPMITISRQAAWVHDGFVGFVRKPAVLNRLRQYTSDTDSSEAVPCIDLARFLAGLATPIVVKIDAEGAEHTLIPHLAAHNIDEKLALLIVEWHGDPTPLDLSCPIEDWHA